MTAAVEKFGKITGLVNSAYGHPGFTDLLDTEEKALRRAMDIILYGAMGMSRAVVPHMTEGGSIVNVGTMSTRVPLRGEGGYAIAKAAMGCATQYMALELGEKGIRVNAIHPGYIYGDSVEWYFNHLAKKRDVPFQEVYDEVASETCLKYLPHSEEIAGTAVYFASALAKPVTGQMIGVNAGHWFNG